MNPVREDCISETAVSDHGSFDNRSRPSYAREIPKFVEIAANEQNERHALEGEMWLLELAWERAELIAGIADGLLVPAAIEKKLQELKTRQLNKQ